MQIEAGLLKVAKAILALKYVEMTEMAGMMVSSVKSDAEEDNQFDTTSETEWCERLRWWAEGYIDVQEDV